MKRVMSRKGGETNCLQTGRQTGRQKDRVTCRGGSLQKMYISDVLRFDKWSNSCVPCCNALQVVWGSNSEAAILDAYKIIKLFIHYLKRFLSLLIIFYRLDKVNFKYLRLGHNPVLSLWSSGCLYLSFPVDQVKKKQAQNPGTSFKWDTRALCIMMS